MTNLNEKKLEEIKSIINKGFDGRMEGAIFSYIMDKGIEIVGSLTDEDINEIEGDGLATANFYQALVRTAREICNQFSTMDIMTYIRCGANFDPFPIDMTFYKDEYSEEDWDYLCNKLHFYDDEAESIQIYAIKKQ